MHSCKSQEGQLSSSLELLLSDNLGRLAVTTYGRMATGVS